MPADVILIQKLIAQCRQSHVSKANLETCCKILLENFKFDCVFMARSSAPEETLVPLAFVGNEEVVETCLYRLGVEERVALAKDSFKTYTDMTGKPVFNKSGSLRIQKPNSGIFMVFNRPKESYFLLGFANQTSQVYDAKLLLDIPEICKQWHEILEKAVVQVASQPKASGAKTQATDSASKKGTGSHLEGASAETHPEKKTKGQKHDAEEDGRRPILLVDEATRLFNKNYFSECLAIEVERARRYSRTLSLLFLSVTPIAEASTPLNEDEIANQVAEVLSKSLRRLDVLCRIEKNKFGIILPDTPQNTYGVIAKRVFKYFKQIMGENPPVFLNISASSYPKHAETHHELLGNAEKLLAQAQEVGPNKAVLPE